MDHQPQLVNKAIKKIKILGLGPVWVISIQKMGIYFFIYLFFDYMYNIAEESLFMPY